MPEEVIRTLIDNVPQAVFLIVLTLAAAFVLREFRSIRKELADDIDTRVKAELGAVLADIQKQTENARVQLTEGVSIRTALKTESGELQAQMKASRDEAQRLLEELRGEAEKFRDVVPKAQELSWISPRDLIVRARSASSWKEAYGSLAALDVDNATSKDLEVAGDICREHRFFKKAIEFYRLATERDADNVSAQVELAALTAEFDASARVKSLERLRTLAEANLHSDTILRRYFNVLIELERFQELSSFSSSHVNDNDLPASSRASLRRNLATSLSRQGRLDKAQAELEAALQVSPNDENTLRAYAALLMETGRFAEGARHYRRLIQIDPTDGAYFLGLGRALNQEGRFEAALAALSKAHEISTGARRYEAESEIRKLSARLALEGFDALLGAEGGHPLPGTATAGS